MSSAAWRPDSAPWTLPSTTPVSPPNTHTHTSTSSTNTMPVVTPVSTSLHQCHATHSTLLSLSWLDLQCCIFFEAWQQTIWFTGGKGNYAFPISSLEKRKKIKASWIKNRKTAWIMTYCMSMYTLAQFCDCPSWQAYAIFVSSFRL